MPGDAGLSSLRRGLITLLIDGAMQVRLITPSANAFIPGLRPHVPASLQDFPAVDVDPLLTADVQQVMQSQEDMERQLSWPDGRTLLRHVAPCLDEYDEPPGVVVTYLDVSVQRGLEERLRKSEANFRLLFADSPDAYLIMAIDGGTVLNCNRAAEVMLRGTREQIIGATPDQLSPEFQPDGRTSAESVPEKIIVGLEKGYNRFEWVHRRFDGESFWAEVTLSLGQHDGQTVLLVAWREIGEIISARKAAEAANEAKSAFLANMSHEIRTPIGGIMGIAQQLLRNETDPQKADRLSQLNGVSRHLLAIVNDILDITKLEAGKISIVARDFELASVFDATQTLIEPQALEKGLELRVEPVPAATWLRGDDLRIRQCLLNFASNAVKFTQSGCVALRARVIDKTTDDALIRFEVADTGIGIAPASRARIFEAFEQADTSTTREFGGSGLGLSITRHLVELMGGEIGVESTEGVGSTFWFCCRMPLGVSTSPAPQPTPDRLPIRSRGADGARVLLVEDNEINQLVVADLLAAAGIEVDIADNGQAAVDKALAADSDRYSLILMDMHMPVMDGTDATRRIRALPGWSSIPIIALTANVMAGSREECLAAGMDDFLTKPIEPEALDGALHRWINAS